MFSKGPDEEDAKHKVMNAELLFTNYLVEHNIAISAADHAGPLVKKMFPDSKIAKSFKCARTKATALINHEGAKTSARIAELVRNDVFSLSTDGSNDNKDKFYPVVLTHVEEGKIKQSLLSIPTVNEISSTGENIFKTLDSEIKKHNLKWENCLAFGSDNAPVMSGTNKGTLGYILGENPNVYFAGCSIHLLHIAAKNANNTLPVSVEDALLDIYYYLKHSAKRLSELHELQELCGTERLKVLKHVPTRWLSLGKCIDRLLVLREPLKRYFNAEAKKVSGKSPATRPQRAAAFLNSYVSTCYCHFLNFVLPIFDKYNTALQADKPMIHMIRNMLLELLRSILTKFLTPAAFKPVLTDINVDTKLQYELKTDEKLVIGEHARTFLKEKNLKPQKVTEIFQAIREFYRTAAKYIIKKLPLNDPVLKNATSFDLSKFQHASFSAVGFFVEKFPALTPACSMDQLEEEFSSLQFEDLGPVLQHERIDEQWHAVSQIKGSTGSEMYQNLANFALRVCLIPHSNASCERVFSYVRKIRTDFRASMTPSTLESLCTVKMAMFNSNQVCHGQEYTKEDTQKAKKATVQFNQAFQADK
jgi:hypothetical protein